MLFKTLWGWGSWVALLVKHLTLAQVVILWVMSSSPASSSALTAWSLEPASDSVFPSLSLSGPPTLLTFSLSKINKQKLKKKENYGDIWVARSVKPLTLDFGSGHDLTVCESEPRIGLCTDSKDPA